MGKRKILIVEDDRDIVALPIVVFFNREQYTWPSSNKSKR
jgi:hypothetical protein